MKSEKVYIVSSEYVANGLVFNHKVRYIKDKEKAYQIYEETLKAMKDNNEDMLNDKYNYAINKIIGLRNYKSFTCYYKYQPEVSNFSVELRVENLE